MQNAAVFGVILWMLGIWCLFLLHVRNTCMGNFMDVRNMVLISLTRVKYLYG